MNYFGPLMRYCAALQSLCNQSPYRRENCVRVLERDLGRLMGDPLVVFSCRDSSVLFAPKVPNPKQVTKLHWAQALINQGFHLDEYHRQ